MFLNCLLTPFLLFAIIVCEDSDGILKSICKPILVPCR